MFEIKKVIDDDTEILPDIVDTSLWEKANPFGANHDKKMDAIASLYNAIRERENYYQINTPTAFGDPRFGYFSGLVCGILQGLGMEEYLEDGKIIIKKNKRKVFIIDKVNRPESYYEVARENAKLLRDLGL